MIAGLTLEFTAKGGELCAKSKFFPGGGFLPKNALRNVETEPDRTSSLRSRENVSGSKSNKSNVTTKTIIMKYALFAHVNKEAVDQVDVASAKAAGMAYGEALRAAGIFVAGAGLGLPQTATVVSVRNGKRQVQDGPYAESKEFLGGFVIIDVPNLDAALEWAARHPSAAVARVEVRPLMGLYFAAGGK
jgi:hypothetical protein